MSKSRFTVVLALGVAVAITGIIGCGRKKMPAPEPTVTQPRPAPAPPVVQEAPRPEPQPAPAPAPERLELRTVYFDLDQSLIRADQTGVLTQNAEMLSRNRNIRVLIEGHCCDLGTNEYNLALGQRRADAVRNFFINYGIDASRIETISYGEERPAVRGQTEDARVRNRRGEFIIISR